MCCPTPPIQPEQCSSGPVIGTQYVQVRLNKTLRSASVPFGMYCRDESYSLKGNQLMEIGGRLMKEWDCICVTFEIFSRVNSFQKLTTT